jgi:DNA polymerase III delta prime subunit
MHAYLFVGGEEGAREKAILEMAKKTGRKVYEFPLQKIADVRNLADFTKLSQNSPVSILIKNADLATREALNAFLKNLEEPGRNVSYFLSCSNEQAILPTIVSRCQIKRFGRSSKKAESDLVTDFLKMSFGQKLRSFENLKKKNDAKAFLQKLVLSAHKKMVGKGSGGQKEAFLIRTAQKTIYNIDLNANVGLQMTGFAINSTYK